MKTCKKCEEIKPISEFYLMNSGYYHPLCMDCKREYDMIYRQENKDKLRIKQSEYSKNNREKINAKRREYDKECRKKNPEKLRERYRKWYNMPGKKEKVLQNGRKRRQNQTGLISDNLRRRVNHALCGNKMSEKTRNILGCDIETYKEYLELLFKDGMTLENRGEWVIDHIIPLSLFNLENGEHLNIAFHFSNTQPLWNIENGVKGTKMSPVVQIAYNNLNLKEACHAGANYS